MSKKTKILFKLNPSWHGSSSESIWAENCAESTYQLLNSPYLAFGISYKDIVLTQPDKQGQLIFDTVVQHSGHSTYRLMLFKAEKLWKPIWQKLESLSCTYEEARVGGNKLLSVDIPPNVDIYEAYKIMEEGSEMGVWDFEEAHVGHSIK